MDFDRLAYRGTGRRGNGIELQFMASPTRADRWSEFRCARAELGSRLIAVIDALPAGPVPQLPGTHLLLRHRA